MISLMDRLLKRENLDLKLTPFHVLATGSDTGLIEFIPSQAIADILAEHKTLTKYTVHKQSGPRRAVRVLHRRAYA